jgi:uncharacterized membrane protein YfcA
MIATAMGLTGVGGGTMTTPILILVLRLPPAIAVGTALTFTAFTNLLLGPIYIARRQVSFKTFGWMLLGGLPGVILGGLLLGRLAKNLDHRPIYLALGLTIVLAAGLNIYRLMRMQGHTATGHRPRLLPFLMFPVGAEVGFSSAGSGALGSLALLGLTSLTAAQVVGTDILFGMSMSVVGSGIQLFAGNFDGTVLVKLLIGAVFGAFAGSMLALRIPYRPLKWALAVWLAGLGTNLFLRGFS